MTEAVHTECFLKLLLDCLTANYQQCSQIMPEQASLPISGTVSADASLTLPKERSTWEPMGHALTSWSNVISELPAAPICVREAQDGVLPPPGMP